MPPIHTVGEVLLSIQNLSLKLGDNQILRNINVDVKDFIRPNMTQGQIVAILGPSGIGKTQLFRTISGLQVPTSGKVLVGTKLEPVRVGQVGVVFQNYPITPRLKVIETLVRAGCQAGLDKKEAREKGINMLSKFGLAERAKYYPAELSGGQRQRVAIAEQLMCSENFILMDEPFSGLDHFSKQKACELIETVANVDEKNTIIVVSHDIETAVTIADTVWLLGRDRDEKGNIIPGARVIETVDLINLGIAWQPNVQYTPEFAEVVQSLKMRFCDPRGPYTQ